MPVHPEGCDCGSYACDLRNKGVQVSHKNMVRHNGVPPRPHTNNQWEKGKASETRPDGSRMPYIDRNGDPIPIKRFSEGFHKDKKALAEARAKNTRRD